MKYCVAFAFPNNGDNTKIMWAAFDCAEWTKMGLGMCWSWRSDVSNSDPESSMILLGVHTFELENDENVMHGRFESACCYKGVIRSVRKRQVPLT